jgi:hypothetical protein
MNTANSNLAMDYVDAKANGLSRLAFIFTCHDNGDVKEMSGGINGSPSEAFGVMQGGSISLRVAKAVLDHGLENVAAKVTASGVKFYYC